MSMQGRLFPNLPCTDGKGVKTRNYIEIGTFIRTEGVQAPLRTDF